MMHLVRIDPLTTVLRRSRHNTCNSYRLSIRNKATSLHPLSETPKIPSRETIVERLRTEKEFDVLIIGAGATGAGAALDAAQRGLKVACIEREDFSSATSSRSTKLLWGGSRYLVLAFVNLLSSKLLTAPRETIQRFIGDFKMVMNCHRERTFLMKMQPHLTGWVPIAVPLDKWLLWPPPFKFPPAMLGPLGLFPAFFKFYDALSGFSCPPSHIMTRARAQRKFPQLASDSVKYCPIFYEGLHDDARTNLAIAQTAAKENAAIANYVNAEALLKESGDGTTGRVVGAKVKDMITGEEFEIRSKSVLLCGGPFTDEMRKQDDPKAPDAVTGAAGIHIVLPRYYAPTGMGLVDMNTSDGRFMFFLPWKGHVLVGTTDHMCTPSMRPVPDESEIKWLLHEASKYISPELKLRRQDVLSAWSGIRPLAVDPYATSAADGSTAGASRDHVISHNASNGLVFISGGKWTTYREMAEDAIDKIIEVTPDLNALKERRLPDRSPLKPCQTLKTHLVGYQGYSPNLKIRLIQKYDISESVAKHLSSVYGGRAHDVLQIAVEETARKVQFDEYSTDSAAFIAAAERVETSHGIASASTLSNEFNLDAIIGDNETIEAFIAPGYPFLEAEVIFAARYEWAQHPEDFLARRSRLAFLNKDAAVRAIPRVVQLMARELNWDYTRQKAEMSRCIEYMRHFGGAKPLPPQQYQLQQEQQQQSQQKPVRLSTQADLSDVYKKVKKGQLSAAHGLSRGEILLASEMLNYPLSEDEIDDCINYAATLLSLAQQQQQQQNGVVSFEAFSEWWNSERCNPGLSELKLNVEKVEGTGTMFG